MENTERDRVEAALLQNFIGIIKPLTEDDISVINKYKDGSFGFSYFGMMLYANGCNRKGESTLYPQGLIYHDGENIFGIGFFKKNLKELAGHLHIIAPRGKNWLSTVEKFIKEFRAISPIPQTSIYIRHLNESQYIKMLNAGYKPISTDPWDSIAPSEDETFNHRFIKIEDIVDYNQHGFIIVKPLKIKASKDFRKKAKMAYNRFDNFLQRNDLKYLIEAYDPQIYKKLARDMVVEHFRALKNTVGSTPQDYFNLINYMPAIKKGGFIGYIGFLVGSGEKIPVSLFIGEAIRKDTVALYATFALRNKTCIIEKFNSVGYSAVSQYSYIRVFDLLKKSGYKYVDLGGSEIGDLDNFKRQLGAREEKTYWVVRGN